MSALVVDTHVVLWFLFDSKRLSPGATSVLDDAVPHGDPIILASISLVELVYLIEKGRFQTVVFDQLVQAVANPKTGLVLALLDEGVATAVRHVPRKSVPDMPDRIIAATALHLGLPLVTADRQIRASGVPTIW